MEDFKGTELKYQDYSNALLYQQAITLADCSILLLGCGALLSTLVAQKPDAFRLVEGLIKESLFSPHMLAIWAWSLYLLFTVAVLSHNLMGYSSYGWAGYMFSI
jgi:hypothetical protein